MPQTVHLDGNRPGDIARAAEMLRAGKLVAFPTETVYGLGAHALDAAAVAGIFAAKQRPAWDPLIVHVAAPGQVSDVARVGAEFEERVGALMRAFWPGPLTLLLPRAACVPDAVTAGRELVGVRVPRHPVAQALLAAAGVPVAAPSANRFGHTSPTTAQHVMADLDGRIDAVLDGGATNVGIESTVVDPCRTPMVVYRPGAVTLEDLASAAGVAAEMFVGSRRASSEPEALPSPGVGIRHYAPRAALVLVEPGEDDLEHALLDAMSEEQERGRRVGGLLPDGWAALPGSVTFAWGAWERADVLGARLYAGLRALDDAGVDVIVAPVPRGVGMAEALRDRMRKAAMLPA